MQAYRGFESHSLRQFFSGTSAPRGQPESQDQRYSRKDNRENNRLSDRFDARYHPLA